LGGACGVISLDILGRVIVASPSVVAQLRDLAAERAGASLSQRDLSLALDRALHTRATVVLQRGEARELRHAHAPAVTKAARRGELR
jgi:hypothetical protein